MRGAATVVRYGVAAACLGLIAAMAAEAAPRGEDDACRNGPTREDRLESVGPRGELLLGSGARAVLSGLRWPDDGRIAEEAKAWLLRHRGETLMLTPRGEEDRWGRIRIDAIAGEDEPVDLAAGLVSAGLATVDAGESDVLCQPGLLAREAEPRRAGSGVWAAPILDARDAARLEALVGRFAVAEGRIVSVGERRGRTYLDFGRKGDRSLSVTVPKRTWRIMGERGLTAATLKGRLVRVRGTVEIRSGPILDIVGADMIEVPEEEQALRRRSR